MVKSQETAQPGVPFKTLPQSHHNDKLEPVGILWKIGLTLFHRQVFDRNPVLGLEKWELAAQHHHHVFHLLTNGSKNEGCI